VNKFALLIAALVLCTTPTFAKIREIDPAALEPLRQRQPAAGLSNDVIIMEGESLSKADSDQFEVFNSTVRSVAKRNGFKGAYGFSPGWITLVGDTKRRYSMGEKPDLWRWASVTKQVIAVLVMQEVEQGKIDLDAPLIRYIPDFKSPNVGKITVRQLLRHQSGLPNPEDAQASSFPDSAFYYPFCKGNRDPLTGYCAGRPKGEPGGNWTYNNCDYMVAGALLKAITGKDWQVLVQERIVPKLSLQPINLGAYPTDKPTRQGFIGRRPEPKMQIEHYGASGALYGSVDDLLYFDRALMSGQLLGPDAMRELWDGQADLGFIALGQWVFTAPLSGCATPVRIVERRGAIGGIQVRNFILPDKKMALVAFTDQGEFEFGEVWQGKGFSYDLLGIAACPSKSK
jgi:D-alanyl-D-alanine carboxypeptidase